MAQESLRRPGSPEAQPARDALPCPTGVFQVTEKLEKRTCMLCPKDTDYGVLYFAKSENIAAHENCLLYSAALVECDDPDPLTQARNFDVESVKKEIQRGKRLKCAVCQKMGATVGCELKMCKKSYHFFCAKKDHTVLQTDGAKGIYKLLCQNHAPESWDNTQCAEYSRVKSKRGRKKRLLADTHGQPPARTKERDSRHTDADVKALFLKKCKEEGLLNDLFEDLVDKLHLIQHKLTDGTLSESEYEEIATSLFDCRLFKDTLLDFQSVENKIRESQARQQRLKELLQYLKHTSRPFQEGEDLRSSSSSGSSLSS